MTLRIHTYAPLPRLAFFSACALFVIWPLFATAGQLNEFRDAQVLQNYELAAVKSVREFGELPLWNPYACGGMYNLGTPQSRFAAPPFLFSLLFGALGAPALIAFAMSVLGMEGFYRYARTRTASAFGPVLIAPLFGCHGYMTWSFFNGWVNFYGFLLLPWVLYGVHLAARRAQAGPLVVALSFAFIIGFGGTYAAPMGALLAVVEALRTLLETRPRGASLVRSLATLTLAGLLAILVSAFRLWPIAESLIAAPRIMAGAPAQPLKHLASMVFDLAAPQGHNLTRAGQMYLGVWVVPLFATALLRRRALVSLGLCGVCVWIAMGYAAEPSLFAALRELPVFGTLRYPQRFLFPASLFALEAAALGLDRLLVRARVAPLSHGLLLAFAALLVAMGLAGQRAQAVAVVDGMWLNPPPQRIAQPFRQARGNRWLSAHYPPIDRGSLSCWEAYPVPMSPHLRSDLAQEEYLADADAGTVTRTHFSPNKLELAVTAKRATRVLINQNYHPGWKTNLGKVVSHEGLLAVDVPAGEHALTLTFRPRSFVFGVLVSLSALAAALAFWRGRPRHTLMLVATSALSFASSFLLYEEPLPAPNAPTNADGSPALVHELPAEAQRLRARFALPVTLEGVIPPGPPQEGGHSQFVLFFRVHGPVPRSVGVSVHFESNQGRARRADHDVIAASMFLADAPQGVLLRDAHHVDLKTRPGETWKMYVSLWHAAGDRTRVAVAEADVPVHNDRVLVLSP